MQHSIPVVGEEIVKWTTASFHLTKRELSVAGDVDIKIYKKMVPLTKISIFTQVLVTISSPPDSPKQAHTCRKT
jgi:hypothetical protein